LEAALDGRIELITWLALLGELARCWRGRAGVGTRDPADDYLVALTHAANVQVLVTGDADLLSREEPGVPVMTPRGLIERLEM
jgi:predicted nucleic acid-binding protein